MLQRVAPLSAPANLFLGAGEGVIRPYNSIFGDGWVDPPLEMDFQGRVTYPSLQTHFKLRKAVTDLMSAATNAI